MHWKYDPETDVLDIYLATGEVAGSHRLDEDVVVDLAADGRVLSFEVLDARKRLPTILSHATGRIEVGSEPLLGIRVTGALSDEAAHLKASARKALALVGKVIELAPA